jgi:hypothetical protein
MRAGSRNRHRVAVSRVQRSLFQEPGEGSLIPAAQKSEATEVCMQGCACRESFPGGSGSFQNLQIGTEQQDAVGKSVDHLEHAFGAHLRTCHPILHRDDAADVRNQQLDTLTVFFLECSALPGSLDTQHDPPVRSSLDPGGEVIGDVRRTKELVEDLAAMKGLDRDEHAIHLRRPHLAGQRRRVPRIGIDPGVLVGAHHLWVDACHVGAKYLTGRGIHREQRDRRPRYEVGHADERVLPCTFVEHALVESVEDT